MKKKIGEIYNKPIVIGNPNEFNKNEVALSDLKGEGTNKEEIALDSDTIQQECYFIRVDKYNDYIETSLAQDELWNIEPEPYIQYLTHLEHQFIKSPRPNFIIGFRYNIASDRLGDDIYDIPDEILEYFIRVPFTRFYDKNTNFFCYGSGNWIESGKELYKRLSKLNLVEGEWFIPNGYIFMIPDIAADDRGIITKVRKVGNSFEFESYRNSQPQDVLQLLPTGEVRGY